MSYLIHKQLIPVDQNMGDPNWAKRQIWVLKLNPNDSVDEFQTLEDAQEKRDELDNADPTPRVYKIVLKNEDGTFTDINY
jgi:hypothetical protein